MTETGNALLDEPETQTPVFAQNLKTSETEAPQRAHKERVLLPDGTQGALWRFVDKQYEPHLPLGYVQLWDQNPRKSFDAAKLQEMADSIRAQGVQQPIVVRHVGQTRANTDEPYRPVLQIVMGERRYRASLLAGVPTIPAIVRVGLNDKAALELAVVENYQRRDLNAIEEAGGFRALLEQGFSQQEIAQRIGASESVISNRMRLLKLPEDVQQMVSRGDLGLSHALVLLKYAAFPEALSAMAQDVVESKIAFHTLEGSRLPHSVLTAVAAAGAAKSLSGHWEMRKSCEADCPYKAFVADNYSNDYCLNPAHIPVRKAEIEAEKATKEAEQQAALEQTRLQALELLEQTRQRQAAQASLRNTLQALQQAKQEENHVEARQTDLRPDARVDAATSDTGAARLAEPVSEAGVCRCARTSC